MTDNAKKLAWCCRRGTRELDRMTRYYFDNHYGNADTAHQHAFEALLELPDPQLHDILTGKAGGGSQVADEIACLIRDRCGR